MCQVHAGAYVSLLAPGKTDYTACHPIKTSAYILHVVLIITHTHDRRKSVGEKKHEKKTRIKERKEKTRNRKTEKERKEKTRKARKYTTRRGSKERERQKRSYQQTLGTDLKWHWAHRGYQVHHQWHWERTQHGEGVRAVLRYLVTAMGRPTNSKTMMARPRLQFLEHGAPPSTPPSSLPPPRPLRDADGVWRCRGTP